MFAIGPVLIAAILGGFCGLWMPLVLFLPILFAAALGCVLSMAGAGFGLPATEGELLAVVTVLEAGYLAGLLLRTGTAKPSNPEWSAAATAASETPKL